MSGRRWLLPGRRLTQGRLPIYTVLLATLMLGGCATLMKPADNADRAWERRTAALEKIDRFTLKARVASGGVFGLKGNLVWRQRPDDFDMSVSGPFGIGALSLSGTPRLVTVQTKNGSYTTPDPEDYLRKNMGWTFPVEGLRYWALGLPSPLTDAQIELDELGRLLSLEQDDWQLEYSEYQQVAGLQLPRKFSASHPEVKIKVVIDEWLQLP